MKFHMTGFVIFFHTALHLLPFRVLEHESWLSTDTERRLQFDGVNTLAVSISLLALIISAAEFGKVVY